MRVYSHEYVNDRISVISFHLNNRTNIPTARPSLLKVINAYARHSILVSTHPEDADQFYHQLQITTHKYRYSMLLFIAGDLNWMNLRLLLAIIRKSMDLEMKMVITSNDLFSVCCLLSPFTTHLDMTWIFP